MPSLRDCLLAIADSYRDSLKRRDAGELIGRFVVVRTWTQTLVGVLVRADRRRLQMTLSDGTLWSDAWGEIVSVTATPKPPYLKPVEAAGRVA